MESYYLSQGGEKSYFLFTFGILRMKDKNFTFGFDGGTQSPLDLFF